MTMTAQSQLNAARRFARNRFNYHREHEHANCHESFAASAALQDTADKFPELLGGLDVEGWCDDGGREGVSYINSGDSYDLTLFYRGYQDRFVWSTYADEIEAWERYQQEA